MGNGLNNVLKTIFMQDSLKRPLVLILMMTGLAGAQNAAAQSAEVIHLWGNVPGETGPKAPHELSANTSRNVKRTARVPDRSEVHTSDLQSLLRISYAVLR